MDALIDRLRVALGPAGVLSEPADTAPFSLDWRGLFPGRARAVLRPASVEAVAAAVRLCAEAGVCIVAQGGNTSMVAGATPDAAGRQVVLSLARLNRVREVDAATATITLDAGVTLQAAQQAAAESGLLLPLSISAEGSATIGGVLSTNAGGNNTLRFGNARDLVLGLEVVLADGGVIHGLRKLRKDNTGYALRQLFVGAEGTLGIITGAVLKLEPMPRRRAAAFCALPSVEAALALFARLRAADAPALHAFEYMSGPALDLVYTHIPGSRPPVGAAAHYGLVDLAGADPRATLEAVLEAALEAGEILDAALAQSDAQRADFWALRENHAQAQKLAGASVKNDVAVPLAAIPALLARSLAALAALIPGCRLVPFGHIGDGNIHLNLLRPAAMADADFLARSEAIMRTVNAILRDLGGSPSAEHGIGRLKRAALADWRGGAELETMRRIKAALDPAGLFNPDVMLPAPD